MNGNYLAQGFKRARKTYKKNKSSIISFIFLSIASMIGKLFFFTTPIFQMFDLSIAEDAAESNEFNMFEGFRDSDNPKSVWILMIINLVKAIFIITGLLLIGLLTQFLWLAGLELNDFSRVLHIEFYFIGPAILAGLVFVTFILTVFAPFTYITKNVENKNLFTVLYNNKMSMNFKMFRKIFSINLVYNFVSIGIPAILTILYFAFDLNFVGILALVGAIIVYLLLMGTVLLTKNISLYLYYKENIVLDATKVKKVHNENKLSDEETLSNVFTDSNALN